MNFIRSFFKKRKQDIASKKLKDAGLEFRKTALGQACFIPVAESTKKHPSRIIFPDEWSRAQFRAMADFMDAFPECTIFDDGSGKPCK
jgi:hypothetical protein